LLDAESDFAYEKSKKEMSRAGQLLLLAYLNDN
jgi:hypothetical protein